MLLPILFWMLIWEGAAWLVAEHTEMGATLLLPGPGQVFRVLAGLAREPAFWTAAVFSLARMFFGIVLGAALGTATAVVTALSPWCDRLLSPAVKVVRAAPVASFILLVLLWVRRGWVPVIIAALMVLPVVWGAVRQGIAGVDRQLLELAGCYRFDRLKTVKLVWIPAIMPALVSGLATAMGLAWKAGVAAEVLCQPWGAIGTQIYRSRFSLDTPALFAWTLVVIVLSLAMEALVKRMMKRGRGR